VNTLNELQYKCCSTLITTITLLSNHKNEPKKRPQESKGRVTCGK
jgi:hypothetical protein